MRKPGIDALFTSETAVGIQQSALRGIGKFQVTGTVAAIFLSRMPDDLEDDDDLREDPPLTPEQEARARQLSAADLRRIDECLLSHTTHQFHKVARVVLHTMVELRGQFPGVPDVFYAGRIKHLAAN